MGKTKEMARIRLELARIRADDTDSRLCPEQVKNTMDFINNLHNAPYPKLVREINANDDEATLVMVWRREIGTGVGVWFDDGQLYWVDGPKDFGHPWNGHIPTRLLTAIRNTKSS